jgi:hypothetical protein
LLWANIFIRIVAGVVTDLSIGTGAIPTATSGPVIAITYGISIALIVMFALALRRADELPAGA